MSYPLEDAEQFAYCLANDVPMGRISQDMEIARTLGVSGTPTFVVNGYKYVGVIDSLYFPTILDSSDA